MLQIKYITIAGKFIKGAALSGPGSLAEKFAGLGYQQVCGTNEVWGDGIIPLPSAHLEGAINLDLEGVYHSPLGSTDGDDSKPVRPLLFMVIFSKTNLILGTSKNVFTAW